DLLFTSSATPCIYTLSLHDALPIYDGAVEPGVVLLEVTQGDQPAHRVTEQEEREVHIDETADLAHEAIEVLEEHVEPADVSAPALGESVAALVVRIRRNAAGGHGLRGGLVAARMFSESVHDDERSPRLCHLECAIPQTHAAHALKRALAAPDTRRAHAPSSLSSMRRSSSSAATAERSRPSSRSPGTESRRASERVGVSAAMKTVPTGFSGVPPPGPATPLIATPHSAPVMRRMPEAMARTAGSLTAPSLSMRAASTPSRPVFTALSYATTPP